MNVSTDQLLELIPHRPPMLMLDEVCRVEPGQRGVGKRVFNEGDPCFEGHFPGAAILPGVLTIEAFAQTALVVSLLDVSRKSADAREGRLAKCNEMAFLAPVFPGVEAEFAVEIERRVGDFVFVGCEGRVDGATVAKGKITLKI